MARTLQSPDDEGLLTYLEDQTGLALRGGRRGDVLAALEKVRRRLSLAEPALLIDRLAGDAGLFDSVVADITVGETYFLREPAQIDAIRRIILPELVRNRPLDAPLRLWSAGCSTGEEAYSLAMIVEEEGLWARTSILATDLCERALARARKAEYGGWSLRADQSGRLAQYFEPAGNRVRLATRLRDRVRFRSLNLASEDYPSRTTGTDGMDLILCRNVLIYLKREHITRVAERLYRSLRDGGWLVTGPSDPPLWTEAPFRTVIVPGAVLYRREGGHERRRKQGVGAPEPRKSSPAPPVLRAKPSRSVPAGASAASRDLHARADRDHKSGLAKDGLGRPEAQWIVLVKELSGAAELEPAEACARQALQQFPLSIELNYLRSMLLIGLERHVEAAAGLRRVLFLDPTLAAAHLALGVLHEQQGEGARARRSLQSVVRLCAARPASEPLPLLDGATAGGLAEATRARIAHMRALQR